jgi:Bacterial Ig domain
VSSCDLSRRPETQLRLAAPYRKEVEPMNRRIAHAASFVAVVVTLAIVPAAIAAKGGHGGGGGGGGGTCTRNAPGVTVENNWEWGATGSWGLPGQRLTYSVRVTNNDLGCSSSSFVLSLSAPNGFSVSVPTASINLASSSAGNLVAYVTSPTAIADGDYGLTASVQRSGASSSDASSTSYYKVYSSDTVAPTLFWMNPGEGTAITSRSYNVTVSSSDDHAPKSIDLYIDGAYVSTKACDNMTYICSLNYTWSTKVGTHTATFKSHDWLGNVGVATVTFTVS